MAIILQYFPLHPTNFNNFLNSVAALTNGFMMIVNVLLFILEKKIWMFSHVGIVYESSKICFLPGRHRKVKQKAFIIMHVSVNSTLVFFPISRASQKSNKDIFSSSYLLTDFKQLLSSVLSGNLQFLHSITDVFKLEHCHLFER